MRIDHPFTVFALRSFAVGEDPVEEAPVCPLHRTLARDPLEGGERESKEKQYSHISFPTSSLCFLCVCVYVLLCGVCVFVTISLSVAL